MNEAASNFLAQLVVIVASVEQVEMPCRVDVFRGSDGMLCGEQQKQEFAVLFGHRECSSQAPILFPGKSTFKRKAKVWRGDLKSLELSPQFKFFRMFCELGFHVYLFVTSDRSLVPF